MLLQITHIEEKNSYPGEGVDVSCFMTASQAALIAFSVSGDVLLVPQLKFSNGLLDNFKTSIISHGLGAETNITISYPILDLKCVKKKNRVSMQKSYIVTCSLCEHQLHSSHPGKTMHSTELRTVQMLRKQDV